MTSSSDGLDRRDRVAACRRARTTSRAAARAGAKPTPLQGVFIYLSVVVLICGVFAIIWPWSLDPDVIVAGQGPVLIGGVLLLAVTIDALVRVWRSVGAWRQRPSTPVVLRSGSSGWAVLAGQLALVAAFMLVVLLA